MLTRNEFMVLNALRQLGRSSQRRLAEATGLSLGTVNSTIRTCEAQGYCLDRELTESGLDALRPYKVDNAIIMAAGFSSRFAPLSYERPKGVMRVRGDVLIERQIRQLIEVGITDIVVVVGYMKEAFFYLEAKFGVRIVINDEYAVRNNNSTLMRVRDELRNTFVCSSDNYFTENVFEPYVYESYYSTSFVEGKTDEYCVEKGPNGRITGVRVGGKNSLVMIGHVYFDAEFSERFRRILVNEYDLPETRGKLWEDIYRGHLDELDMKARVYARDVVHEFDSMKDLLKFDHDFVDNVDSKILDNICSVLRVDRNEIKKIKPIKEGLTNLSFRFAVGSKSNRRQFVYRHPGPGTDEIINRVSETYSQAVSKKLGIDNTFVYEHPEEGWKLSRYIKGCIPFDYHNAAHVSGAMELIRRLHRSDERSQWSFDVYENAIEIVGLLASRSYPSFPDADELAQMAARLNEYVTADAVEPCLCHNDFYAPNFLIHADGMDLIDWEYSAMSDYASDLGTFICCSDYSIDEARDVIAQYFNGNPTAAELRHCLAYVSLAGYYWFVWALFKEASGDPVGEWLYLWYKAAKTYGAEALRLYADAEL